MNSTCSIGLHVIFSYSSPSRYLDSRLRSDRVEIQTHQWTDQMDRLVAAYLDYRLRDSGDGMPTPATAISPSSQDHGTGTFELTDIELVDMFSKSVALCYVTLNSIFCRPPMDLIQSFSSPLISQRDFDLPWLYWRLASLPLSCYLDPNTCCFSPTASCMSAFQHSSSSEEFMSSPPSHYTIMSP